MDLEKSLNKLYSLHTFGIKLGLDNIRNFLTLLGKPQNKIKTIHIAGSNGKGSTAAFTASILQEMKYKVGLYTSPHFSRFNERIKINGKEISNVSRTPEAVKQVVCASFNTPPSECSTTLSTDASYPGIGSGTGDDTAGVDCGT